MNNKEDKYSVYNEPLEFNVTDVNYTKLINDTYVPNVHNSVIFQGDEQGSSILLANNDSKISLGFPYINDKYIVDAKTVDDNNGLTNIRHKLLDQLEAVTFVDNTMSHNVLNGSNAYDYIKPVCENKYSNILYVDSYNSIGKRTPISNYTTLKIDDNIFNEIRNKTQLAVSGIDDKIKQLKIKVGDYKTHYTSTKQKTNRLADYKHNNKSYIWINDKINDSVSGNNTLSFKERLYKCNEIYYKYLYNKNPDINEIKKYRSIKMLNSDLYLDYTSATANKEEAENKYNDFKKINNINRLNTITDYFKNIFIEYDNDIDSLTGLVNIIDFPTNVFETNITNDDLLDLPKDTLGKFIANRLKTDLNSVIDSVETNTSYRLNKYTDDDIINLIYNKIETEPESFTGLRNVFIDSNLNSYNYI